MTWQLFSVLNNLAIKSPFDSEYVAIVGPKDRRLVDFMTAHPAARPFVEGFTSTGGRDVAVSALMLRDDAPDEYKTEEAIYSFRNVYALTALISGLQDQMLQDNNGCVTYSTFFDLYPVRLDKNNEYLITTSPVIRGLSGPNKFQGQPDPAICNNIILQPQPDSMLAASLLGAWKRHTENLKKKPPLTMLFRSLNVAYQAASLPRSNSIHEYGSRIALWVSAIEILAHPPNGNANLGTVMDLLDEVEWDDVGLRERRFVVRYRNRPLRCRFIGKVYRELYQARNDFLHGNHVAVDRLFPFKKQALPLLPRVAPLIYKAALLAYIERHRDRRAWKAKANQDLCNLFNQGIFEDCLLRVKGESTHRCPSKSTS